MDAYSTTATMCILMDAYVTVTHFSFTQLPYPTCSYVSTS